MDGTNTGRYFPHPIPIPGVAKVPCQGAPNIEKTLLVVFHIKKNIIKTDKHQLGGMNPQASSAPGSLQVIKIAWRRAPEINQAIKICVQII